MEFENPGRRGRRRPAEACPVVTLYQIVLVS